VSQFVDGQQSLFGIDRTDGLRAGRAARDEAMERAERGSRLASEVLYEVAIQIARRTAIEGKDFIADDIWTESGLKVREPRVMGPVMDKLRRHGYAYPTDRTRQGYRGINHARPQTVWQGRL